MTSLALLSPSQNSISHGKRKKYLPWNGQSANENELDGQVLGVQIQRESRAEGEARDVD